ncbi:MAG: YicC family protein [Gammaproteobacteria bacterium]|nr:YicC family protein [Gammaproteobacteria bacterium]
MIHSMTGYGEAARETDSGRLRVEIRTVNHRFFNANLRTPPGCERHHARIERWLKESLPRGHVSYSLTLDPGEGADPGLLVDVERARAWAGSLENLAEELGLESRIGLDALIRLKGVIRSREPARLQIDIDEDVLRGVTEDAANAAVRMRRAEGERLKADLLGALAAMREELDRVEERAPARLAEERDRLSAAIEELLGNVPADPDRIAREIAHLAERWDINEEIVRLRSHMLVFEETLDGADGAPVGKRLGFIMQEMHREANTIGAKANDARMAEWVMSLKGGVERIREQLENVQ